MMSKIANYVQKGKAIDYKNSGSADIAYGDVISLTTRIAVATSNIAVGDTGAVEVEGVFDMPKATEEIALGAAVYWSVANKKITATSTGNVPAGWAIAAAASADTRVLVKIG